MQTSHAGLTPAARRRAIKLAYGNAVLWSIGNGLTTGTLIYYLLMDLGARGLQLSLILALPALLGLLRLSTPLVVRACGSAKRACLAASLASYLVFLALPSSLMILPPLVPATTILGSVIGIICLHQVLEYVALVALLAWLADIVPQRVRGRFFARRQMWQLAVLIPTLLASGYFAQQWKTQNTDPARALLAYSLPLALGAVCLLGSLVPLAMMPATKPAAGPKLVTLTSLTVPFRDRRFLRLLTYRGWFSLANGITQAAQNIYPRVVLGLDVGSLAVMRTVMQSGQFAVSPAVGRWVDRIGNRPVLIVSQALVAASLVFFLISSNATTTSRWLVLGAWVLWSAYAGINVCLPNLTLKLSPTSGDRSPYIAAHEAIGSVFYAASTVAGGYFLDVFSSSPDGLPLPVAAQLSSFETIFIAGLLMRGLAVIFAARIVEPGARSLRSLFSTRGGQE